MDPVVQAVLIGLPATVIGVLGYQRSRKVDAVAQQSGVVTENRAGTAQIIEGLNDLVNNLQMDNKAFRDDIRYINDRFDKVLTERDELRSEVTRLRVKCGEAA